MSVRRGLTVFIAATFALLAVQATAASAAKPPLLGQFPSNSARGSGADQIFTPRELAVHPTDGRIYLADSANERISIYDAWGSFDEAWGWGVADGSPELQRCGPAQPEFEPPPSLCRQGLTGSGAGQFASPNGVAVDAAGNVYVLERDNGRVQKFNSAGEFLLMFGGEVNKTTNANVCTKADLEEGDVCGKGVEGTENGFFSNPNSFVGNYMALGTDGTVYVGDKDRIQLFDPSGSYIGQLPLPDGPGPGDAKGRPGSLAFDAKTESLYFTYFPLPAAVTTVYKLDPASGAVLRTIEVSSEKGGTVEDLATAPDGTLYVAYKPGGQVSEIRSFAPSGTPVITAEDGFVARGNASVDGNLLSVGANSLGNVYVGESQRLAQPPGAQVNIYGPPPIVYGPPPVRPPLVVEGFASSVDAHGATVKAVINPRFWADTRFFVEYGSEDCDLSTCRQTPAPPGGLLTEEVVDVALNSPGVILSGLEPETTYHYRFVAESTGGGPIVGPERTFTTRSLQQPPPTCGANQVFRTGVAAFLPDCRAYEMVSPLDKGGANIEAILNGLGEPASYEQVEPGGEKLTYSSYRAFGDTESAPYAVQFLAERSSTGWGVRGISPPRSGASLYSTYQLDSQYKGFSDDLCRGWFLYDVDVPLAEGAVPGWPNIYRRDFCGGGYLTGGPLAIPKLKDANAFLPEVQGVSADGSKAMFIAAGRLTADAAPASQLYEGSEEGLRLVCILPSGAALKTGCSGGGPDSGNRPERSTNVANAMSDDGSTIYWTASVSGAGKLYVRVDATETVEVSSAESRFLVAAPDGSRALYSTGGELRLFDLATQASTPIAGGFAGFLGAGTDLSNVYFVSTEVLDSGATGGQPNLYRYEEGAGFTFIATLTARDVKQDHLIPSNVDSWPKFHASRSSADGSTLAFISDGGLTGLDNLDVGSRKPTSQVYVYRADAGLLACVSCDPTGARAVGRQTRETGFWSASQLPLANSQLYAPQVLTADGDRLFFESFDDIVPRDTNGKGDVYQWEAVGTGSCGAGSNGFDATLGGCVDLISSGKSPVDSSIVDAGADGADVFFKTAESLVSQDPDLVDIYDARVEGGFPPPPPPPAPCEGEACQQPLAPPSSPTPASATFQGPGNQVAKKHKKAKKRKARAKKKRGGKVKKKDSKRTRPGR